MPMPDQAEFIDTLVKRAKQQPLSLALPEGHETRVLQAAHFLLQEEVIEKVYLGNSEKAGLKLAHEHEIPLEKQNHKIVWMESQHDEFSALTKSAIQSYWDKKGKPNNEALLEEWSDSYLYQAAQLVGSGKVASGVAGCYFTTADVIKAGLSLIGLSEGIKTISGSMMMVPGANAKPLLFADCGVVIKPTTQQVSEIACSTLRTWQKLCPDQNPAVAFLSFSTKGSAVHEDSQKMADAWQLFKELEPSVISEGEVQFDAAFSEEVGQRKIPGSQLPGKANIFIFPDLGAGNITYKMVQRLGGYQAFGPILQGMKKPWSDLSRGANWQDIAYVCLINILCA